MPIVSIQALRTVAAWMVVLRHVEQFLFDSKPATFLTWLFWSKGAAGVEIFFVISGFIMVVSTTGRPVTAQQFLMRRLIRVAPMYWIATLLMLVVVPSTVAAVVQSLMFSRSLFSNDYPVLYVGWTLEYELVFYLLFALGIQRWWFLPAALLALQLYPWSFPGSGVFRSSLMLLFLAGYTLGHLQTSGRLPKSRWLGWLLMAVGVALIVKGEGRTTYWWAVGATCVVWSALCFEMKNEIWARLGDQSYAVYLLHPIVIATAMQWSATGAPTVYVYALASTAVGATLIHSWIERPVTRFLKRQFAS